MLKMKRVSTTFIFVIASCAFYTVVTTRPLSSLTVLEKGSVPYGALINTEGFNNDDNEPIKRDDGGYESEAMINTPPFMSEDDNEPVKRDNGVDESEVVVNKAQLQDDNNKRQIFYSPVLNSVKPSPPSGSTAWSGTDDMNNDPWPIDKLPVIKKDKKEKEKRRIPGVNPINYFGNERLEEESDGSDDLFGASVNGESGAPRPSAMPCLLTLGPDPVPSEYWPNGYGN